MPIKVAIHGAAGRMGQRLTALASADRDLKIVAAIDRAEHPQLGQDVGLMAGTGKLDVLLTDSLAQKADVVIDFSSPEGTVAIAAACREKKVPLVVATTGLELPQLDDLRQTSRVIPILWSPSMSLAVNLAMKLAAVAAEALKYHPSGADVEILERHHRFKEDAPSGTALKFGQIIADIMGQKSQQHGRHGRPGSRPHGEIGYHAIRTGDNPGEHTIVFGLLGESLELNVRATNRDCYAHGALVAAKFLANKPVGMYSMGDVLGL